MRKLLLSLALILSSHTAQGGPWLDPGDSALRHDIRVLADAGVITGPVSTQPLATADLVSALDTDPSTLDPAARFALSRLVRYLSARPRTGQPALLGHAAVAGHPREIRGFEDGPRESAEIGGGLEWTGPRVAVRLQAQRVADPDDGKQWRADDSYLGVALGNWMLAATTSDRYWGPGWHGSLILGNNARPVPAITLERTRTTPFGTRWLSWLGPWDLALLWGFLDDDRMIEDARLFGGRLAFRPVDSLEIGISGLGLWCGAGNDCGGDELVDLVTGAGTSDEFDRLGGFDLRWSNQTLGVPFAVYTHLIGEDFGDGASRLLIPSKLLGQFGLETWGYSDRLGSYRLYVEWADTECDFSLYRNLSGDGGGGRPGCAYRNSKYLSGETYRGRSIAHGADQDSSIYALGAILGRDGGRSWLGTLSFGNLNRRGASRSTVAANKTRYWELELVHRRKWGAAELTLGVGYERREDTVTDQGQGNARGLIEVTFVL